MASEKLKEKIYHALENIPEQTLEDVLSYLRSLSNKPYDKEQLYRNLDNILKEDQDLLERLAK